MYAAREDAESAFFARFHITCFCALSLRRLTYTASLLLTRAHTRFLTASVMQLNPIFLPRLFLSTFLESHNLVFTRLQTLY